MISVDAAQALCLDGIATLPAEDVALADAAGRVLAIDVRAHRAQPPFAASAMDGYAVRSADTGPGARLVLRGAAPAGHAWAGRLQSGEALRIFTGAPVPDGADAVVIQEDVTADANNITLRGPVDIHANIRAQGSDFPSDFHLEAPRILSASDLALLAAMNAPQVAAVRRPVVALIPTGDELVMPGSLPRADQIIASNIFALKAMVESAGGIARIVTIARDSTAALEDSFAEAEGADIVVTIGGASVGDHDLVAHFIRNWGITPQFHKVALRPGKPLMSGHRGAMRFLGLPGNPVSAIVCGHLFLLPMVRRMLGLAKVLPPVLQARLTAPVAANGPRAHYMRAQMADGPDGREVTPFDQQDSAMLTILAGSNCLLLRPPGDAARGAGAHVPVLPLDRGT
jgi:molybdopterin molybdotransferase